MYKNMDNKIKSTRCEVIRSYAKIWTMPLKIYAIEKTKLIIPINIWDMLFFIFWELIFLILNYLIPNNIPNSLKFGLIPYLLMKFMSIVKLEGKQPHKYFYDLLVFLILPKKYEYFEPTKKPKNIKFDNCKIYLSLRKEKEG